MATQDETRKSFEGGVQQRTKHGQAVKQGRKVDAEACVSQPVRQRCLRLGRVQQGFALTRVLVTKELVGGEQ